MIARSRGHDADVNKKWLDKVIEERDALKTDYEAVSEKLKKTEQISDTMVRERNHWRNEYNALKAEMDKKPKPKQKDMSWKKRYIEYQRKYASKCSQVIPFGEKNSPSDTYSE